MNDVVIEGLFVLGAAALGGLLAIFASRSGAEVSKLKEENKKHQSQLEKLLKQIEAYHLLEDLYANDLAGRDPGKAVRTVKTEYRNKAVEAHQCTRPEMTANEAKKQLQNIT
jgi:hypothetical protein